MSRISSSVGAFNRQARADVAGPMQQDRKDDGRGDNACHVVRDLRVGGGERGDAIQLLNWQLR